MYWHTWLLEITWLFVVAGVLCDVYIYINGCVSSSMCVCICVCMQACMYVCIRMHWCVAYLAYIYIYIYMDLLV